MNESSLVVVVFPSVFAKNKSSLLISNIKKILKIQDQKFGKITRDDSLIILEANDPVFASSAINLLFGISQVSIARKVENKFDVVTSAIAKIGTNLLLQGEQFLVKVDGHSSGYLPKDVEIAATSALIEKTVEMDCKPGTSQKYDKIIHCFLTKKNAYVSIFLDKGYGGIPYNSQETKILCCVYDELSAISCLESIKQGFDVRIVICYNNDSNLLELVKMVNRIMPRTLNPKITLDFVQIPLKQDSVKILQQKILAITEVLCYIAEKEKILTISLSLSPLAFPVWFIEQNVQVVQKSKLKPWITLAGIDESIISTAKEIGLEKHLHKIEKFGSLKFTRNDYNAADVVDKAVKTRQTITVKIGPNNIHDILDSLNH